MKPMRDFWLGVLPERKCRTIHTGSGIFRFLNQTGSWHGQKCAGKKSGNNSQLVVLQYRTNVAGDLSWHFSPKSGQIEFRNYVKVYLFCQIHKSTPDLINKIFLNR
jgi:hypothetical protein